MVKVFFEVLSYLSFEIFFTAYIRVRLGFRYGSRLELGLAKALCGSNDVLVEVWSNMYAYFIKYLLHHEDDDFNEFISISI